MIHYDPFVAACMIGHLEVLSACDKSGEWQVALSLLTVPWLKNDQSDQGPPEDFWVTLRSCPGNFTHFGMGHVSLTSPATGTSFGSFTPKTDDELLW